MDRKFVFSIDLDWIPGSDVPMLSLFDLFESHQVKPTMFFTAGFARNYQEIVHKAVDFGYNIGTHGLKHGMDMSENFGSMKSAASKRELLFKSTDIMEELIGFRPIMFRAPYLNISGDMFEILAECGYKIDSSLPAKRFDFFRGSVNSLKHFTLSSAPFIIPTSKGQLLEIPPSSLVLPMNMRCLHMFKIEFVMQMVRIMSLSNPCIIFYLHPTEFIEAKHLTLVKGHPKNFFAHCCKDNIRLLDNFIRRLKQVNYSFCSLSDLANDLNLP